MAQPAPAKSLRPTERVKIIDAAGGVNKPVVNIPNGGILEFISEVNDLLEIQFIDPLTSTPYTLAVPVTAHGTAYFIGNNSGDTDSTIEYNIQPVLGPGKLKKPLRVEGMNQIIVGGGGPEPSKRRK